MQNRVVIVVVPHGLMKKPPLPSKGFKDTVCNHLDKHRLITTDIEIQNPEYIQISVNATVKTKGEFSPDSVRKRCITELDKFLSPIKKEAGDKEWPFGRTVYRSEAYEVLEDVEGVDSVMRLTLSASAGATIRDGNVEIIETSIVHPGEHYIEVILPKTVCVEKNNG